MISFDVENFRAAFDEAIGQVTAAVDEPGLRAVGFAGAEVFRDEAKRNAQVHIQTGTLHRSIIAVRLKEESDGSLRQAYKVTVRNDPAFYWRFVEYGHKFVPRNTKISERTGRKVGWKAHRRAAELEYGTASAPAYPFMRPAYSSKRQEAVDVMTATLREQIKRNLEGG